MAGDWIKIEHVTPDKPEVWQIAETLGIDADAVVGKLVRIWVWADQQTTDGNARSVTKALLDRISGVTGFAAAMVEAGWLQQAEGGVQFVNFERHNGETAKQRALTAKRVQKHRAAGAAETKVKRQCNAAGVTSPLPEKRREEKNNKTDIETRTHARAIDDSAAADPPVTPVTTTPASSVVTDLDGPGEQIIVPERMQHPDVMAAARRWFRHLQQKDPTRVPLPSSPQLQEWWARAGRLGPQRFLEAVSFSVSRGYLNLVEESQNEQHGRTGQQPTKNEQRESNNRNAFAKLLGEDFADAHFSLPFQAGGVLGGSGHDMGDGPQLLPG
jgi:hypothetical protein